MEKLLRPATWGVAGLLLFFTGRRWLLTWAALQPGTPGGRRPAGGLLPPVLLLVPFRNEARALPELLQALARLDYPADRLTIVFIDDGSTDGSPTGVRAAVDGRDNWSFLSLPDSQGKARALNAGLAAFPSGEIVAIYDADERPEPAALRILVAPFSDGRVGAVSGRRAVSNSLASPAASYATFEELVHQLVTMRAKDRLDLVPGLLGANCAYRRVALEEVGAFKPGALLEDSDLTLKLARAGWQIRFEPAAVSYHRVPESVTGYWRQHTRWARGFNEVARHQAGTVLSEKSLSLAKRLELLAFAAGYLDRLALLAGAGLALLDRRRRPFLAGLLLASLLAPLGQIMAALKIGGASRLLWARLAWVPLFFGLDIAMAAAGLWGTLQRSPQIWEERQARP